MKTEMEILKMNESQKICWLYANRFTLIIVGFIWIGMIFKQLIRGKHPYFLIIMVPVFSIIRILAFIYYRKKVKR